MSEVIIRADICPLELKSDTDTSRASYSNMTKFVNLDSHIQLPPLYFISSRPFSDVDLVWIHPTWLTVPSLLTAGLTAPAR